MDKNDAYGRVTYINLDDDDELFSWYGWPTKGVALFPAGTIVIDSQHHESSTRREKQSFADVLQNICSENFCKFHSKTTVLEPLFAKGVVPQDCSFIKRSLQHRCFPVKFAKLWRTPFLQNTYSGCFCNFHFGISFFHVATIDGRGILISAFSFFLFHFANSIHC